MKRSIAFLSTAAICAVVSETPAAAQVAGKIGDLHTQTLYIGSMLAVLVRGTRTGLDMPARWVWWASRWVSWASPWLS
jgi:hypothetical protein